MEKDKKEQISYNIFDISRLKYIENSVEKVGLTENDLDNTGFDLGFGIEFIEEHNLICINIIATLRTEENSDIKLLQIETQHQFKIKGLKQYKDNDNYNIPDEFMKMLLAISFSDTRGMLITSTNNPYYKDIILPLINTNNVIADIKSNQDNHE